MYLILKRIITFFFKHEDKIETSSKPIPRRKRILEPWTEEQKEKALSYFENYLARKIPPKKNECLLLKEENPELFFNKSWEKIKIFTVNTSNKKF